MTQADRETTAAHHFGPDNALTTFWFLVPARTVRGRQSRLVGWLTFGLTRPTIPAWTAAASC